MATFLEKTTNPIFLRKENFSIPVQENGPLPKLRKTNKIIQQINKKEIFTIFCESFCYFLERIIIF